MGFEKALLAVKVIKDRIQYRSQSLLNLARGYFSDLNPKQAGGGGAESAHRLVLSSAVLKR